MRKIILLLLTVFPLLFILTSTHVQAQGSDIYDGGLRIKLNESGDKYLRMMFLTQVWTRWNQNNPGTADINGLEQSSAFDIGIRRSRLTWYAQLTPRFLVYTQWGINNQRFDRGGAPGSGPKKPQVFIHDAWTEYTLRQQKDNDFSLSIGAGLHFWNGLSRMSNASILSFLMVDLLVYNFPHIEFTDQFARQMGIYAKGKAGPIDYRLHLNRPFAFSDPAGLEADRARHAATDTWSSGAYLAWEFQDREGNTTPFRTGTYLGDKQVFNIGVGYYLHPEATATLAANDRIERHNELALAVDVFADQPFGDEGMAWTLYGVWYHYDMGPNYYRSIGIMNTGNQLANFMGNASVDGPGNAEPLLGTGDIFHVQSGLLLPESLTPKVGRWQMFAGLHHKRLAYLDAPANRFDAGINFFHEGHNARLTLQYSARPVVIAQPTGSPIPDLMRSQIILQSQIYL
ncbi:MAG: porin [Bacteroidota bacterium]